MSRSIAEQTIGLIVGSMPVLPAMYRHLSEHYFTSGPKSSTKIVINSFFANRRDPKPSASMSSQDPSRLRGYEELDEIESQWGLATSDKRGSAGSMAVHVTV